MTPDAAAGLAAEAGSNAARGAGAGQTVGSGAYSPLIWVLAVAPPLALLVWSITSLSFPADIANYQRAVADVLAGRSPYRPEQAQSYVLAYSPGFVYPPSAAVILAPLTWSQALFTVVSLGMLATGLVVIVPRTPFAVAVVLLAMAVHPGVTTNAVLGNVNTLLAGLLAWSYVAPPRAAAVLAGLAGAVKLHPFAWAVLPARDGWLRAAAWTAVGAAIPAAVSALLVGVEPWAFYPTVLANGAPECATFTSVRCAGLPSWVGYGAALGLSLATRRLSRPWALLALGAVPVVAAPEVGWGSLVYLLPGVAAAMRCVPSPRAARQDR